VGRLQEGTWPEVRKRSKNKKEQENGPRNETGGSKSGIGKGREGGREIDKAESSVNFLGGGEKEAPERSVLQSGGVETLKREEKVAEAISKCRRRR